MCILSVLPNLRWPVLVIERISKVQARGLPMSAAYWAWRESTGFGTPGCARKLKSWTKKGLCKAVRQLMLLKIYIKTFVAIFHFVFHFHIVWTVCGTAIYTSRNKAFFNERDLHTNWSNLRGARRRADFSSTSNFDPFAISFELEPNFMRS